MSRWSWLSKAASLSWCMQSDRHGVTVFDHRRWFVRGARMNSPWCRLQVRQQRLRPCTMLSAASLPTERCLHLTIRCPHLDTQSHHPTHRASSSSAFVTHSESGKIVLGLGLGFFTTFFCLKRYISLCRQNLITYIQFFMKFAIFFFFKYNVLKEKWSYNIKSQQNQKGV